MGHDKARGVLEMAIATALYQMGSAPHNQFALSRPSAILPPHPLAHTIPPLSKRHFEDAVTTLLSSFGLQICDVTHLKIG